MIDHADIERLDERYVRKEDCSENRSQFDTRINTVDKTLAVCSTKLNILIGIMTAIGTAVLGIAVKLLFGGA